MRLKIYIFTPKEPAPSGVKYVDWTTVVLARSEEEAGDIFAEYNLKESWIPYLRSELLKDFNIEERKAQRGIVWNNSTLRRRKVLP